MRTAVLLLLTACGGGLSDGPTAHPGVRTWVEETSPQGVVVVSQVTVPADAEVQIGAPTAPGLDATPDGETRLETIGDLQVVTQRWTLTGDKGHYQITGPTATWGDRSDTPSPLYVDIGVAPPREGELVDIDDPTAIHPVPWLPILGGAGLIGLVAVGAALAFRAPRSRPTPPPPPPHERALAAWAAAWADPDLDDEATAAAVSRIFREYVEEVLAFPASAWTTTEILDHLARMPHLQAANLPRAKRLLRATDRVKYADADATRELFDELDADLRAFVDSTRPRGLDGRTA